MRMLKNWNIFSWSEISEAYHLDTK